MNNYTATLYSLISHKRKTVKKIFTLNQSAMTSASVWNDAGVKVRELWTLKQLSSGEHPVYWDGLNDDGIPVSLGNYNIKIASNNLTHTWSARIGNTSSEQTGASVHRMWLFSMVDAVSIGQYIYYCAGYSERRPSVAKFLNNSPQGKIDIFENGVTTKYTDFVATDNTLIYWAGYDPYNPLLSWVSATKVSDDKDYVFSSGSLVSGQECREESGISFLNQANSLITGMDVMKSGNYLFVARANRNQIQVLNKTTGALVRNLTFTTPKRLRIDSSDNLWISYNQNTIEKFTINQDGTLTSTNITISGVTEPGFIAINGTSTYVVDYATQQVKEFSNSNGSSIGQPFGRSGGYNTNAIVYTDKFCLKNANEGAMPAFIVFNPDNSFWLNDVGNNRILKFSQAKQLLDTIMYLPPTYSTWVNPNKIQDVGGSWLQFEVNYNVPMTSNSGWTLTRNWSGSLGIDVDQFTRFLAVQTFTKNGVSKTFGIYKSYPTNLYYPFEMRVDGTFRKGSTLIPSNIFDINGNAVTTTSKYEFIGFNQDGDPIWDMENPMEVYIYPEYLPAGVNIPQVLRGYPITDSNKFIAYQYGAGEVGSKEEGYHLGAVDSQNRWVWKTQHSTPLNYFGDFPDPSYFDVGNSGNDFAGSAAIAVGNLIVTGYHGEFWKNSQTNKYNIYNDNGLPLMQIGATGVDTKELAPVEMAGNALTVASFVEPVSGDLIIIHGDEAFHGAIHMFRVSGLNTIKEITIPVIAPSNLLTPPVLEGVSLMTNIPFDARDPFIEGWTYSPTLNSENNWSVYTNKFIYDRLTTPDINVFCSTKENATFSASRVLGDINSNNWKLTGLLGWQGTDQNGQQKGYFEVIDINQKIISTITFTFSYELQQLRFWFNGELLSETEQSFIYFRKFNSIEISNVNGDIKLNYGGVELILPPFDPTCEINKPHWMRCRIDSEDYRPTGIGINLKDFRFKINGN